MGNAVNFTEPEKEKEQFKGQEPQKIEGKTICSECGVEYPFTVDGSEPQDKITVKCPECGHEVQVIASFKTELMMKQVVTEMVNKLFTETSVTGSMIINFDSEGFSLAGFGKTKLEQVEVSILLKHIRQLMEVRGDLVNQELQRITDQMREQGSLPQ